MAMSVFRNVLDHVLFNKTNWNPLIRMLALYGYVNQVVE